MLRELMYLQDEAKKSVVEFNFNCFKIKFNKETNEIFVSTKRLDNKISIYKASSGLQSIIPLFVHLDHITKIKHDRIESFANLQENSILLAKLDEEDKKEVYPNYVHTHHCDIFLEEPEANLFPPTQSCLVEWLLDLTKGAQPSNLFIATHSPYILNAFMEKQDIDMTLLYTRTTDGLITVKAATEQDFQGIYDYGVDAFFNIETLG